MKQQTIRHAVAIAVVGAITLGATSPTWAVPQVAATAAASAATASMTTEVRYRGRYRGRYYRNDGAGVALGILGIAGAVAGAAAYDSYGGPGYYRRGYYGGPGYGYGGGPGYGYYGGY